MKTQLLEDIGQSATLSLVPSDKVSHHKVGDATAVDVPARAAPLAKPRSTFGVWRQKPGETVISAPDLPPALATSIPALAPIAAADMQQTHEHTAPQEPILPAAPTLLASAPQIALTQQGPVFHFTPPSLTAPSPVPTELEPSRIQRSGSSYLKWGACALSGVLVVLAGLWSYNERKDAGAPALVADEMTVAPARDKGVTQRALAAKEFTLDPDGEVQVTPAAPAATLVTPAPSAPKVPPLVLIEPEGAPAAKPDARPEPVVKRAPASIPKRVRPTPRAPVMPVERKAEQISPISATLKACTEHGYTAAQCAKRACSMTKYGFVCRGK